MDNKLTNEEIAKVFAMYVPCMAVYQYKGSSEHNKPFEFSYQGLSFHYKNENLTEIKLPLTPLSKISDEDAIDVAKLVYGDDRRTDKVAIKLFKSQIGKYVTEVYEVYEYIKSKGYAVPLFFAPNHPCNGQTAIELGLAIDKTKTL